MKKKIAVIALIIMSIFSLIVVNNGSTEVSACDAPLPEATIPQPCG